MKTFWALTVGIFFSLSVVPQSGAAPQFGNARERTQGRDRVCVYQDIRYQGWEQCYAVGDEIANLGNRSNNISSIRVFGRARVAVYENQNFNGRSAEFTADVPDLGLRSMNGSKSWSDHIQSLRVASDTNSGNYPISGNNPPPVYGGGQPSRYPTQQSNGVCVYDRPDYQGREQCWSSGQDLSDLGRAGNWSDRIASIRVFGGTRVMLYRDVDYRGESVAIDRDVPNLAQISGRAFRNWERQASSLQIGSERGFGNNGRGRGRGRDRDDRDDRDFRNDRDGRRWRD